jgi:hypothetical protein
MGLLENRAVIRPIYVTVQCSMEQMREFLPDGGDFTTTRKMTIFGEDLEFRLHEFSQDPMAVGERVATLTFAQVLRA